MYGGRAENWSFKLKKKTKKKQCEAAVRRADVRAYKTADSKPKLNQLMFKLKFLTIFIYLPPFFQECLEFWRK